MSTLMNNVRLILILLLFCTQTMAVCYAVDYSDSESYPDCHKRFHCCKPLQNLESGNGTDNDETPVKKKTPLRPTTDKVLGWISDD